MTGRGVSAGPAADGAVPAIPTPPSQRAVIWYAADPTTGLMILAQMGYGPTDQRQLTPGVLARATALIRRAAAAAGLDDATMARVQSTVYAAPDGRLALLMLSRPVTCCAEAGPIARGLSPVLVPGGAIPHG